MSAHNFNNNEQHLQDLYIAAVSTCNLSTMLCCHNMGYVGYCTGVYECGTWIMGVYSRVDK